MFVVHGELRVVEARAAGVAFVVHVLTVTFNGRDAALSVVV
jgi:hypothetical protein